VACRCIQVVENIGHDAFVLLPHDGVGETVDLDRQPFRGGLKLAYHQGEVVMDAGVVVQVELYILAVETYVGLATAVELTGAFDALLLIVGINLGLTLHHEIMDEVYFSKAICQAFVQMSDGGDIYMDITLDASCTTLTHATPVDEAVGDKGSGRNGAHGFVEVLNFDCGKVDADHITIHSIFAECNPIANLDQVIHVDLEIRQEPFDAVLEYEDDDGCGSCECAQNVSRLGSCEDADDGDDGSEEGEDANDLGNGAERRVQELVAHADPIFQGAQGAVDQANAEYNDIEYHEFF